MTTPPRLFLGTLCMMLMVLIALLPIAKVQAQDVTNGNSNSRFGRLGAGLERLLSSPVLDHQVISQVNSGNHGWRASLNSRFANMSLANAQRLAGTWVNQTNPDAELFGATFTQYSADVIASLPTNFDARTQWGRSCPSISSIRDQGNCGSCWAVAAASVITDRICLENGAASNLVYSAADPLACCTNCGSGCNGGYADGGFTYWISSGLVTGGEYGTTSTCYPYPVPDCNSPSDNAPVGACSSNPQTPTCPYSCISQYTTKTWSNDKSFGAASYALPQDVDQIKAEIYSKGPILAAFTVYSDFYSYTSGVYQHVSGGTVGGHAVRVLGWGVENGVNYWLVANSWGTSWGLNGFFKYIQGTNEGGFEINMYAAISTTTPTPMPNPTPTPSPSSSSTPRPVASSTGATHHVSSSSSSSSAPRPVVRSSSSSAAPQPQPTPTPQPIPDAIKQYICAMLPIVCPYLY